MNTELRTVADAMTRRIATVTEGDVIKDIDDCMHRLRVRHLPVVDQDGTLVGLLSHPDLLNAAASFLSVRADERNALIDQVAVGSIMQEDVLTVHPDDPLLEAGKLIWAAKTDCLPVVDSDGKLVGILTEADFVAIAVELLGGHVHKSDVDERARAGQAAATH